MLTERGNSLRKLSFSHHRWAKKVDVLFLTVLMILILDLGEENTMLSLYRKVWKEDPLNL